MKFIPKRKLNLNQVNSDWLKLQSYCASRRTWPQAVLEADKLLDKVLKKRGYKGKTTGERLVAAQHDLNFNEEVWFSHKYASKLREDSIDVRKLKKQDIAMALAGIREALRDVDALPRKD